MPHIVKFSALLLCFPFLLIAQQKNGALGQVVPIQESSKPHPYFRNFGTAEGLASPEVYAVEEDENGYLWFATDNGLSRFDGYEFKTFGPQDGLSDNVVLGLKKDAKGDIWLNSLSGRLSVLSKGSIQPFALNHLIDKEKKSPHAETAWFEPKKNCVYMTLAHRGILEIDCSSAKTRLIKGNSKNHFLIHPLGMSVSRVDGPRTAGERGYQIEFLDKNGETEICPNYQMISESLKRVFSVGKDTILASSSKHLFLFAGNSLLAQRESLPVNHAYLESNGAIWVSFDLGGGLVRYENITALINNQGETYLEGESVSCFFRDKSGRDWITTLNSGVWFCPSWNTLIFDKQSGFDAEFVASISPKNDSVLFVGLKNFSIYELQTCTNKLSRLPIDHSVDALFELKYLPKRNQLLLNSNLYDVKTGNFIHTFAKSSQAKQVHLSRDGQHAYLVTTGLLRVDLDSRDLVYRTFPKTSTSRTIVSKESPDGRILIGKIDGLFELNLKDSSFKFLGHLHPAFKLRIEDFSFLPDHTVAVGTKGAGVILWKNDTFIEISTKEGLLSSMVERLHTDKQGALWVGTLQGLNKIQRSSDGTLQVSSFTTLDGLPSNEITDIETVQGQVWVATTKGLARLSTNAIPTLIPKPLITNISVNNRPLDPNSSNTHLKHGESNFLFQFRSIQPHLNGKIEYRFRFQESDVWQETRNTSVNIRALEEGINKFEVQARSENNPWTESTVFAFTIAQPFWRIWWFWVLILAVVTGAVIWYSNSLIRMETKRRMDQEQMFELERSALQAQMSPHFIFNALNSIQLFIQKGERMEAMHYLSELSKLIRQSLEFSTRSKVRMEEEIGLLEKYMNLEKLRRKDEFNWSMQIDPRLDRSEVEFPPMLIQPFLENALIHGFSSKDPSFSRPNGHIWLIFEKKDDNSLWVRVEDNGRGMNKDKEKAHDSMGISLVRRRLSLWNHIPESECLRFRTREDGTGTVVELLVHYV